MSPADIWNSLAPDNVPTCATTARYAESVGREHILAKLTPAQHLVSAVHGSLPVKTVEQLRVFRSHRVLLDTRKQYGGHVLAYLRWADDLDIPPHTRFPIPPTIVLLYFSSTAPFYAANTLGKMVSGLQAWHAVHSLPWALDRVEARTMRQAISNLALPPLELRRPVRLDDFEAFQRRIDVKDRAHTAILLHASGLSIENIKHLGGWQSDAALRYIQDVHFRHADICSDLDLDSLRSSLPTISAV